MWTHQIALKTYFWERAPHDIKRAFSRLLYFLKKFVSLWLIILFYFLKLKMLRRNTRGPFCSLLSRCVMNISRLTEGRLDYMMMSHFPYIQHLGKGCFMRIFHRLIYLLSYLSEYKNLTSCHAIQPGFSQTNRTMLVFTGRRRGGRIGECWRKGGLEGRKRSCCLVGSPAGKSQIKFFWKEVLLKVTLILPARRLIKAYN